ncbi:hypothetical protein H6G89_28280 [Oscillatoria sp. FACHB-1407]|uniref:hypothetical protein n=1 Tax=Oscillatoria sp. FACHB-1407 TaxID=2692847 RepID=UPI0016884F82|nr:hypothetical protein [Oscillatoria sp. FACHB-1407]MBD2464906.1 hypothetical protein [Oscillatoria sp. FACHB-1407]
MRSRAERNQDFEAIKADLFDAGVAALQAAQAGEQLFDRSIEAIAEAMDIPQGGTETSNKPVLTEVNLVYEIVLAEKQDAEAIGNYDAYVTASRKLQTLEDLDVERLEREARKLEAQLRIANAQRQLTQLSQSPSQSSAEPSSSPWTESRLKREFKTLEAVRSGLGIEARTWKKAVEEANQ